MSHIHDILNAEKQPTYTQHLRTSNPFFDFFVRTFFVRKLQRF